MSAKTINSILADPIKRANLERRFWSKVDRRGPNECWPWIAKAVISNIEYGAIAVKTGCVTGAHRVSWALSNGPISETAYILHTCDYPKCCNPKHLYDGTPADNARDMVDRGRHRTGEMTDDRVRRASETRRKNRAAGKHKQTDLQRETARKVMQRRWADAEWRKRFSEMISGENNPAYGKPRVISEETKKKIGDFHRGKKRSEETKSKLRKAAQNRQKISEATREKMRISALNRIAREKTYGG